MWDVWHVGWSQSIVVGQRSLSGSPTPGARLLAPHVAAARVDEWFPLGGDELSSRAKLFSIAAAVCVGAGPRTETRVLREWVARAFRERALVAYELPPPVLSSQATNAAPPPAAPKQAPVEEGVTWFSLKILDEVGVAISGLDVTYSVAGTTRTVVTDGAGIARVDNVKSGLASASIAKLDQVRDKLRSRWEKPRDPKKFDDPDIVFRELGDTVTDAVSLENETEATLVITPYFKCHEIPGAHFAFGRSFVLAEAIDNLAAIAEDLSADNGRKGMIFGHTDLSGPEALNKELSERRAKAVFALFTQDTKAWDELWNGTADGGNWQEKWDLEEAQHMLNALHVTDDNGQPINEKGVRDAPTKQAINRFRSADYPEKPDEQAPLPPSDFLGQDGRKELFLAYAKLISRKPIDAARFQKAGGSSFMGCGEYNPLSIAAKDQESRRAVVFVFDGAAGPKDLPCKLRNLGPCNANCGPLPTEVDPDHPPYRCKVYQRVAAKCPCQGGADLSHDLIVRVPFSLEIVNGFDHVLIVESDDGTISRKKTLKADARALDTEESEVYFPDLPPAHQYRMRAEGVPDPYEVFPFTPFEELSHITAVAPASDEEKFSAAALAVDPPTDPGTTP